MVQNYVGQNSELCSFISSIKFFFLFHVTILDEGKKDNS